MKNRKLLLAAALFLSPLAALAQTTIDKTNYSLSMSSHWSNSMIPSTDPNTAAIMDVEHEAFAWTSGMAAVPGMTADQYFAQLTAVYRSQFTQTDSSDKQLGGKTFKTTGWKDLDSSEGADDSRLRIYSLSSNGLFFVAWIIYTSPEGDPAVAEFESVLATLQVKNVGIRRQVAARATGAPAAGAGTATLDLLGRARAFDAGRRALGVYITLQ